MLQILGSSVSYRVAVGPQQGRKVFMIRTIGPLERADTDSNGYNNWWDKKGSIAGTQTRVAVSHFVASLQQYRRDSAPGPSPSTRSRRQSTGSSSRTGHGKLQRLYHKDGLLPGQSGNDTE